MLGFIAVSMLIGGAVYNFGVDIAVIGRFLGMSVIVLLVVIVAALLTSLLIQGVRRLMRNKR
jgi:uncharacterized membrane protein